MFTYITFTRDDRRRTGRRNQSERSSLRSVAATIAPCKRYENRSPRRSPVGCSIKHVFLNMFNFGQLSEQLSSSVNGLLCGFDVFDFVET